MTMRPRPYLVQSSAAYINPEVEKKIKDMMAEFQAAGITVSYQTHDEIFYNCPEGKEDQIDIIREKYFPRETA